MKIIIFYIFLILIFIPILFKIVFITRTVEGFNNGDGDGDKKEKKKKKKEVEYKLINDNGSYSFLYGKNTIEILPSNKSNKLTDVYFHYRSLPDKTIANSNYFEDITSQEFIVKTPKNKYKITFSSTKKPITIIVNESQYMIELEKKDKEGKFDILWYNKVSGSIDGFDIKLSEKKLDDIEVVLVLYTSILIIQKMKDLDNIDYNKMFK
jgi:hypothetical protein